MHERHHTLFIRNALMYLPVYAHIVSLVTLEMLPCLVRALVGRATSSCQDDAIEQTLVVR